MHKDRVEGSVEHAKGKIKEVAAKVTGDSKLESEGKADPVAGKDSKLRSAASRTHFAGSDLRNGWIEEEPGFELFFC
jgi:uncharacterized protein YjbJ (UPF0337 family)